MSSNKSNEQKNFESIKANVNPYADSKQIPKSITSTSGNTVGHKELIDKLRSADGLTQREAGVLLFGTEENWKNGKQSATRGAIRKLWSGSINPETEVSVGHTGSDEKLVYFIVERKSFKYWYTKFIRNFGYTEKLDSTDKCRNIDVDKLDRG